jgi:GAF domain-containing protein
VANFLFNGITGAGMGFLIAHSLAVSVLLGQKAHYVSLAVVSLTYIAFGWLMGRSILPSRFPVEDLTSHSIKAWSIMTTRFIMLLALISSTFLSLINGLENSILKQAALSDELTIEKENLEIRVQERTERLDLRVEQLRTIAEISRSISSILDHETLFQNVVNLLKDRLDLYYAGIFIVEETGQFAILRAGTGEAGRQMLANGHRLQVGGTSMIGWSVINRMPGIALDVGQEAVRFNNPLLPETRSELALPILSKDNAIGALTIQSDKPNAFDEEDILIFQGISDSLSVALENARLFQQTQDNLNEIRYLSRQYLQETWGSFMQTTGSLTSEFENPLIAASSTPTYSHTIPVFLRNEPIGEIILETADEALSSEDQQLINSITAQAVLSLESTRLLQETQRQAIQEEKINQISAQFTNAFDIQGVLETALKEISQLPSVSEIAVHLVPPENQLNKNASEVSK